jgi:hypothetical protein
MDFLFSLCKLDILQCSKHCSISASDYKQYERGEMFEEIFTPSVEALVVFFWIMLIGILVIGALWAKNKI